MEKREKENLFSEKRLEQIRGALTEEFEETFSNPKFILFDHYDTEIPEKLRRGEKIPKSHKPIGEYVLAYVLLNKLRIRPSEEEYQKLKEIFIEK